MRETLKYVLSTVALATLVACGGGGGDDTAANDPSTAGPLDKYLGTFSYCDQVNTRYSVDITSADGSAVNITSTEVTYENANCSGAALGTKVWNGAARLTYLSTSVGTVDGPGLPSSLTIDKVQITASNISQTLTGPGVTGNCVRHSSGTICYDIGVINLNEQGAFYLSGSQLYQMYLENGVYIVDGVYTRTR